MNKWDFRSFVKANKQRILAADQTLWPKNQALILEEEVKRDI